MSDAKCWSRWVQWLLGIVLAINMSFTSWVALKIIQVDRDLVELKATAIVKFQSFDKMELQVDETYRKVIKIAAKLDVESE